MHNKALSVVSVRVCNPDRHAVVCALRLLVLLIVDVRLRRRAVLTEPGPPTREHK
jgi:hypothetical protein